MDERRDEGERAVKRGVRVLPVVLTAEELAHVAQDMARITAAREDAEAEVEAIKSEMKERVEGAKGKVAQLTASLGSKARVLREGRVEREVPITIRVEWAARRRTVTRDDTSDVVESGPASQEELDALCTWHTEGVQRRLVAPDGSIVRSVLVPDAERQADLPLAGDDAAESGDEDQDGEDDAPAGTSRVWVHGAAWRHLSHDEAGRLEKPDPRGPTVTWREDGAWFCADVPSAVLSQVEAHARKAEVRFWTQRTRPTLADLRAQTEPEPTRLNPKARKGVLPPKD